MHWSRKACNWYLTLNSHKIGLQGELENGDSQLPETVTKSATVAEEEVTNFPHWMEQQQYAISSFDWIAVMKSSTDILIVQDR